MGHVAYRTDVHQGTGQERADRADIDGEATLHLAGNLTFDDLVFVESHFQFAPHFGALGLFAGQTGEAHAVIDSVNRHFHFIAFGDFQFTGFADELAAGDDALGLEAGVNGHPVAVDGDHGAFDDGTTGNVEVLKAFFKKFGKRFSHGEVSRIHIPTSRHGLLLKGHRPKLVYCQGPGDLSLNTHCGSGPARGPRVIGVAAARAAPTDEYGFTAFRPEIGGRPHRESRPPPVPRRARWNRSPPRHQRASAVPHRGSCPGRPESGCPR